MTGNSEAGQARAARPRRRGETLELGAECVGLKVRFRVWAPAAQTVDVVLTAAPERILPMEREEGGWFTLMTEEAGPGSLYRYRINADLLVPDPASRFQPQDVHGPSEVIDPRSFLWSDADWQGRPWEEAVLYELHVGTFSPEGTYTGAAALLPGLVEMGVTAVELMPLSDFPGRANWGYDGVLPFAPDSSYGRPDDLKSFIQTAHGLGLMVFLDVVYNHFGPDGNFLAHYAPQFFTARHHTPWGDAINFDGPESGPVRQYFLSNVRYWLNEYHFDGLRFDAIHAIADESDLHIVNAIVQEVMPLRATGRHIHLVLENEDNAARFLDGSAGRPATAQWNDDVHHVLHTLLTGETGGYYEDYAQQAVLLLGRCLTEGFAYQGDFSPYRGGARGEPSRGLRPTAFVSFLQNHDQIGNRAFGERITALASPEAVRAAMTVLLLAPSPPLLFMGQEFACSQPFLFFCDFDHELGVAVTEGRRREFARFPEFKDPHRREQIPDPNSPSTFEASRLDWRQAVSGAGRDVYAFYRDLLRIRREEVVSRLKVGPLAASGYEVVEAAGLRAFWRYADGAVLSLCANFGEAPLPVKEPEGRLLYDLSGPPAGPVGQGLGRWGVRWYLSVPAEGSGEGS